LNKVLAQDIMTESVSVIHENMLIAQAAHLMLRARISGYPVVDPEGKVIGIVTLTDLFILVDKIGKQREGSWHDKITYVKDQAVKTIMSKNVICIAPTTPISEIVDIVVKWGVHTFPVVENEKLVGIIGRHDILNAAFTLI
jgi:CBS domain-containing protein